MKAIALVPILACLALPAPCGAQETADIIYHGGPILTMAGKDPAYAEALAVKDGRIAFVGSKQEAFKLRGGPTQSVDLGGRTLLPGFLDGHGHFINSLSVASQANCYAPPFGPGDTKQGILDALKRTRAEKQVPDDAVLLGYGYDDSIFPEGGRLTAADLDAQFPVQPVMVQHVSLHGAVLNSAALRKYGITAATETPPGGIIARKPGGTEPEGLLMETAFLPIFAQLPKPGPAAQMDALVEGQKLYAAAGITTAHEGATHLKDLEILQRGARERKLFMDVIAFPFITEFEAVMQTHPPASFGHYDHRLKLGGIKVTIDGSPQGRTAHFTTPYLTGGPGGEKDWKGEPTFPVPLIHQFVRKVYDAGVPLIIHCNGDAAIDNFLAAHEAALGGRKAGDHRTGIIHCQFVRPDQLDKIAAWRIIPSFYTEHTFFFGSTHVQQRGREQAYFLSPLKSALDRGIVFANHTDFNVAPVDQLFVVWTAVNRLSREGEVIGPAERISPYEALKALTVNPAYWYREERSKGTLEAGKLADLVILDRNPLTVEPMDIRNIKVVETLKEGKTIYRAR
ncbi:MAG: amidohydrolase [Verrucomicrobiales bacterium]|nr:amidohydrolase [Verrucomicrobiales bacterium]